VQPRSCAMCGWVGPRRKMWRWGGDWAKQIRWGSPVRHFKWACRDEAACQERQAQRKEMAGG
jgi:hypothetical protein